MKIGILAWECEDEDELESLIITQVAHDRGHDSVFFGINDITCAAVSGGGVPQIRGEAASTFDVIVSRAHLGYQWRGTAEALYLLSSVPDLVMLDSATPHIRSVSKFAMIHRLTQVGVPTQPTRSCSSIADFEAACAEWGSTVVKPSIGFGGHDVERFLDGDDEKGRLKVGDLLKTYGTLLCQPYFPHSGVLRVTTIGDQPSVSFNQVTGDDGWKPNHGHKWVYHAEDDEEYCACCTPRVKRLRNEMVDPKPEMVDLALRAAAAMELSMAGVDIIESDGQAMVLEVNACPGFSSLQSDLRTKIGEEIVQLAEERVKSVR